MIKDGVTPVPVGAVVYGDGSVPSLLPSRSPGMEQGGLPELARYGGR